MTTLDVMNIVEIENLHFERNNHIVFNGIDVKIPKGKVTAIMGPSGTGKTTILRLMGGQLQPTSGTVTVFDQNINKLTRRALYKLRNRMGMLFQNGGLFTHLNVFENVAFPLREHTKLSNSMIRSLVLMKLEMVGLRGTAHLMPSELSGGMARRIALARAIALDPQFIMYDEPLTGQDPISKGVLVKLIRTLNDALGLTSVIVSHDVKETLSIADYVYVMSDGKIIGQGRPDELNHDDPTSELHQFLVGLPDGPVAFHYPAEKFEQDLMGEE